MVNVDRALDRPAMPAAPRRLGPAPAPRSDRRRLTFAPFEADVAEILEEWTTPRRNRTQIIASLVRAIAEPDMAPLRARILADADEATAQQRRR